MVHQPDGMAAAAAVSAALFDRERTGQGQLVETSLMRQGAYTISFDLNLLLMWGATLEIGERTSMGNPAIFNTDQGVQFTSKAWIGAVEGAGVRVSMDGKGRCFDNIFVERLWRTVTYEDVDLRGYSTPAKLREVLKTTSGFTMRGCRTNRWATKARWSSTE